MDIGALVYSALSKGAKKVQDWADSQEVHDEDQLHGSGSQILSSVCDLRCYIESSMVSTEGAVSSVVQDAARNITSEIESLRVLIAKMDETTKDMSNHMKNGCLLPHQIQEERKFVDADPSTFAEVLKCGQLSDSPSRSLDQQTRKVPVPGRKKSKETANSRGGVEERDEEVAAAGSKEGEWTLVKSLRKRNIQAIVGKKQLSESESSRIRVAERRTRNFWDIYVGQLADDTTKSEIEAFLKSNGVEPMECWLLKSSVYLSLSARIRVAVAQKETVLNAKFRPFPSQRKLGTVRRCLDVESHSSPISQRFSLNSLNKSLSK